MRHLKKGRKFGRTRDQRQALFRTLAGQLIVRGRLQTTEAKVKELQPKIEKLITRARTPALASQRMLSRRLPPAAAQKLIRDIAPRYAGRPGGYTRIIKLGPRRSDSSSMAIIEFVQH